MFIFLRKHYSDSNGEDMRLFVGAFDTLHALNDEVNRLGIHDSNRYCYAVVNINECFDGFEMDCIDIETPYDRKRAACQAECAERERKLKDEREIEQARRREIELHRMDAIRKAFNTHEFSHAVPFEVIEYLNDLHGDVQLILNRDDDPYFSGKICSIKRRLEYYSKHVDHIEKSMASSQSTQEDHAIFRNILREEFDVFNIISFF